MRCDCEYAQAPDDHEQADPQAHLCFTVLSQAPPKKIIANDDGVDKVRAAIARQKAVEGLSWAGTAG
jgi:hypothetical protein